MPQNSMVTFAQARLDAARKEVRAAAIDFDISDERLLELRANLREADVELRKLDEKLLGKKGGLLGALKFW